MLSSTAKNIYWMGRYLQRAKTTARLIEATQRMALQSSGKEAEAVVAIFGMEDEFRQGQAQNWQAQHEGGRRLVDLVDFLAFDETNPSSIASAIRTRAAAWASSSSTSAITIASSCGVGCATTPPSSSSRSARSSGA